MLVVLSTFSEPLLSILLFLPASRSLSGPEFRLDNDDSIDFGGQGDVLPSTTTTLTSTFIPPHESFATSCFSPSLPSRPKLSIYPSSKPFSVASGPIRKPFCAPPVTSVISPPDLSCSFCSPTLSGSKRPLQHRSGKKCRNGRERQSSITFCFYCQRFCQTHYDRESHYRTKLSK